MLLEFPSAARISENLCVSEYLMSKFYLGSLDSLSRIFGWCHKFPLKFGRTAVPLLRQRGVLARTTSWSTYSSSWRLRKTLTPTRKNFSRGI